MDSKTRAKIEQLRHLVWMQDVPSPTVPEYVELHNKIQKIMKFIDEELLAMKVIVKPIHSSYYCPNCEIQLPRLEEPMKQCMKCGTFLNWKQEDE